MDTVRIHRRISSPLLRIAELKNFIGKDVEIIISETHSNNTITQSAAGILSSFRNQSKIDDEKQAWKNVMNEKHGNS
jgi:hypothetical protein